MDSLNTNIAMTVQYEPLLRGFGEEQVIGVCGPSELHAHGTRLLAAEGRVGHLA